MRAVERADAPPAKQELLTAWIPSPRNEHEERFFRLNKLREDERLVCQVICDTDLVIEVPKETQLPHLTYQ